MCLHEKEHENICAITSKIFKDLVIQVADWETITAKSQSSRKTLRSNEGFQPIPNREDHRKRRTFRGMQVVHRNKSIPCFNNDN